MIIEHSKIEDILKIKPLGALSYRAAVDLSEFIRDNTKGIRRIVIDMSEVDYCSSAGIRTILELEINMSKLGGLELCNVNDAIMNVFKMTGLDNIFTIK